MGEIYHLSPAAYQQTLDELVAANPFVREFYPNALRTFTEPPIAWRRNRRVERIKGIMEVVLTPVAPMIETICRRLYGRYLQTRAQSWTSPEQVRLQTDYLELHTCSHRYSILERFDAAMSAAWQRANRSGPRAAAH
jgi:hypothetical protein